jgi:hypothetical protein
MMIMMQPMQKKAWFEANAASAALSVALSRDTLLSAIGYD